MKPDILTIAAVVFVLGVLVSSTGVTDVFASKEVAPPPVLHQAVTVDN